MHRGVFGAEGTGSNVMLMEAGTTQGLFSAFPYSFAVSAKPPYQSVFPALDAPADGSKMAHAGKREPESRLEALDIDVEDPLPWKGFLGHNSWPR